jgi:hypothetical protein
MLQEAQPMPFEGFTFEIGDEDSIDGAMIYYGGTAVVAISFPYEATDNKDWKVSLVEEVVEVLTLAYEKLPDNDWDEDGLTFTDYQGEEFDEFEDEEAWERSMSFLDSIGEEDL